MFKINIQRRPEHHLQSRAQKCWKLACRSDLGAILGARPPNVENELTEPGGSYCGSRDQKCSKSTSRGFLRAISGAGLRNAQKQSPQRLKNIKYMCEKTGSAPFAKRRIPHHRWTWTKENKESEEMLNAIRSDDAKWPTRGLPGTIFVPPKTRLQKHPGSHVDHRRCIVAHGFQHDVSLRSCLGDCDENCL